MESRFSLGDMVSRAIRTGRLSRKIGARSALAVEMALRNRVASDATVVQIELPDYPAPFHLRVGTSDAEIFRQVILEAQYDIRSFPQYQKIERLFRQATAEGERPLIIDCGANIGLSAVWFARLFPEAQIFAVEPATDNIAIAKRNLRSYPNISLLHGAIWDRSRRLTIADKTAEPWSYQVAETQADGADPDGALQAFTIPDIMDMAEGRRPFIVKIDIEGAEATLFRSNTDWVRATDLITIELHDWMLPGRRTSAPFLRAFVNLDFDLLQRGENLFVFIDQPGDKNAAIGS